MLGRRPQPGGDQQRAELVTVQRDRVGLVVHPRAADMGSWGVIQELFLHGVPVEPSDGAQPPGNGGPGAAPGFQLPGEALDVGAANREQGHGPGPAPGGELAQVQAVGLAGQAAVPGQEPGQGEPFSIGEDRLDGDEGGSGHRASPGRAETREAGPTAGPSD